jgi:D-alanyl-lipoteichoic acid acyltransferase DltB (MBOAT superfamily)
MLFNSIEFAIYLPVVFLLYWFVAGRNYRLQNAFVLLASYVFYGWWDWRFLSLIIFSSTVDYVVGLWLAREEKAGKRKLLLAISICVNLGFLGFFKYFNFFSENFAEAFTLLGEHIEPERLNIILPVGISFYTFQTLSYSIDIYRRKLEPTKDIIAFFSFVAFFPQLMAGPIERATRLLPQFSRPRVFDEGKSIDGMRQILWGLFKKVVIADQCAFYVHMLFNSPAEFNGSALALGAFLFAVQIYGDFSGYSDIAIGTARLFGFNLMKNFAFPYFSRDIAEFWRRWHISLSSWFRDYLYIPLGGSRGGTWMKIRNTFAIFLVSGFWHRANWTFIVWGGLNALYFLPLLLSNRNRNNLGTVAEGRIIPGFRESIGILSTFALTLIAWVFFRAQSLGEAFQYLGGIFTASIFSAPNIASPGRLYQILLLVAMFFLVEWNGRDQEHAIARLGLRWKGVFRYGMYYMMIALVLYFSSEKQEFIYFQF